MSSDRGTIHRGVSAGPEQQAAWPEPTAPSGRRPPSTPRERKPVLAALAVLLIVGGAAGAGYLLTRNAKRVAAIEITQQVSAGQKFPLSAMQQVDIAADSGVSYVPWSEASQVAQFYAGSAIPPGTLLNSAMVVRASNVTAGKAVLGLALVACPGTPGGILSAHAAVLAINTPSASSGSSASEDVVVAVAPGSAGVVACNAANGLVGIAIVPGSGQQAGAGSAGPATQPTAPAGSGSPSAGSSPSAQASPSHSAG